MYSSKIIYVLVALFLLCCKRPIDVDQQQKATSYRPASEQRAERPKRPKKREAVTAKNNSPIVQMTERGGVYEIPIKINGVEMNIIFDTGASSISISLLEAQFLAKQGKIDEDDILGSQYFQDATGNISEGMAINLKTVQIANRILYDVEATVVDNLDAPLLLGQSALSQFGEVYINYNNKTIRFE